MQHRSNAEIVNQCVKRPLSLLWETVHRDASAESRRCFNDGVCIRGPLSRCTQRLTQEQAAQHCIEDTQEQAVQHCFENHGRLLRKNSGTGAAVGCRPNARHLDALAGLSSKVEGTGVILFLLAMCEARVVR